MAVRSSREGVRRNGIPSYVAYTYRSLISGRREMSICCRWVPFSSSRHCASWHPGLPGRAQEAIDRGFRTFLTADQWHTTCTSGPTCIWKKGGRTSAREQIRNRAAIREIPAPQEAPMSRSPNDDTPTTEEHQQQPHVSRRLFLKSSGAAIATAGATARQRQCR